MNNMIQSANPNGFCDLCQKKSPTKIISGNEVCFLHVSEREWDLGVNLLAGEQPTADCIELFVANGSWMARSLGPHAKRIVDLFGTNVLPTAFTSEAVPSVVIRAIEKLNPDVEVFFRSTTI